MDTVLANRLGLLFSFLAGFLLAPELIGQERLARLERWLEEKAAILAGRIQTRRRKGIKAARVWARATASQLFSREPLDSEEAIEPTEHEYSFAYSARQLLGCYLIPLVVSTVVVVITKSWLLRLILLPILVLSWLVYGFIALWGTGLLVLRLLRGSNKLRSLMVVLGVCLYVVGNLLQFWATF